MSKRIIGVYKYEEELKEALRNLEKEGQHPEEITLVVKEGNEPSWLKSDSEIKVETDAGDPEADETDPSFFDKVKNAFRGQNDSVDDEAINKAGGPAVFKAAGMTDLEAKEYDAAVQSGKIVLLVPKKADGVEVPAGRMNAHTGDDFDINPKKSRMKDTSDTEQQGKDSYLSPDKNQR